MSKIHRRSRCLAIASTLAFAAALLATAGPLMAESVEVEATTYGAGSGNAELVLIADILAAPEQWRDQEVRVRGEIVGVCPNKGCWMELHDGESSLRVKVEDDVIIFPADATGKRAVAQGRVEVRDMTRDAYLGWARNLAEEKGEAFDAASIGDGPYRLVQIRGTGAEIDG